MIKNKVLLKILAFMVILLVIGVSAWSAPPSAPANVKNVDHITLTWTADPHTTQTITWRTNGEPLPWHVQYEEADGRGDFSRQALIAAARTEILHTNSGDMNIHSVTLTGLKPGTRYRYRVGDTTGWSETHTFMTAADKKQGFKFLVFGDAQSINYNVWRATLQHAVYANADAAFFINVGDLVDVGQDYKEWNGWFGAAQGVIDTIPAMPVTGNHENYTPEHKFSLPEFFTAQFKLPANGPELLQGQVYSFDYGDVHFIMLDSQQGEEGRFIPDMLERQKVWLEQDLAISAKKWNIVVIHRPPFSNKAGGDGENIRAAFVPIFDKYHIDVVFTGHEHVYARTYPLYGGAIADSTAKGTVYVATGRSGSKTYHDMTPKQGDEFFYNPVDEPIYLVVEVNGNRLKGKVYKQSGILIDEWSITKAGSVPLAALPSGSGADILIKKQ